MADAEGKAVVIARGDVVTLTVEDRTVDAKVVLASPNGRSLILAFEAMLDGHVGMMPVFQDDDGVYHALISGTEVTIAEKPKWVN